MSKEIVSVSLGASSRDYEFTTQMFGDEVHIRRVGAGGDVNRARELISEYDGKVDVIGLGEMSSRFAVDGRTCVHQQVQWIAGAAKNTPVVDGFHVKSTLERLAIAKLAKQRPGIFTHKRIFILSGIERYNMAEVLGGFTSNLFFGDPIFNLNLPFALSSFEQLDQYARLILPTLCRSPYNRFYPVDLGGRTPKAIKYFDQANIIVGSSAYLHCFAPDDLRHKGVVTDALSTGDLENLRARGVEFVLAMTPALSDAQPYVGADVVEAIFTSFTHNPLAEHTIDDYLGMLTRFDLEPEVVTLNEPRNVARFAFVIHPLSAKQIFNHPKLRYLRFLPQRLVEWGIAQFPPLYVSRMTGIKSAATGKEVEGYLITLGATPHELMRHKPGFTYRRLIVASRMAQQMGADIMGLGAFTKVVGDAGITVGHKADIAITSGNSLTVAATLEAAKQAVIKMGAQDITKGRAVVIGATGAIGAVCSRLLAQAIGDVALIAPRPEKLVALKKTIEEETPGARVTIATDAGPHLGDADLVVTTTTAIGEKVIDVLNLKPGCVVCDVARPPDVKEEDARLRPDILVIESGEILLPGNPNFGFNIGLPPGVAYACLAETALLAMEDRYENFTLGRNIEMERVKEIYRMFKKHGLQLEGLRSFGEYITDEDIARKRELADELRRQPEKLQALITQARLHPQAETRPDQILVKRIAPWVATGVGAAAVAAVWFLWRRKQAR